MSSSGNSTIPSDPHGVFFDQLKDIRSVEEQVGETMPALIGWATEAELKAVLAAVSVARFGVRLGGAG